MVKRISPSTRSKRTSAPRHFRLPYRMRSQLRLLLVGDAEVSVLDGVDEELHETDDGGLGVGAGAREDGAEVARFVDRAEGEDRGLHERERLRAAVELRLQVADLLVVRGGG